MCITIHTNSGSRVVVSWTTTGAKVSNRRGLIGSVGATDMLTLLVSEGEADSAVIPTSLCCGNI